MHMRQLRLEESALFSWGELDMSFIWKSKAFATARLREWMQCRGCLDILSMNIYVVDHCIQLCWFAHELALRVTIPSIRSFASEEKEVFEPFALLLHLLCLFAIRDPSFSKVCSASTAPNGTAAARPNASRHRQLAATFSSPHLKVFGVGAVTQCLHYFALKAFSAPTITPLKSFSRIKSLSFTLTMEMCKKWIPIRYGDAIIRQRTSSSHADKDLLILPWEFDQNMLNCW